MKKSLIILLSVIIAMHAASCAEDLITETAIIDRGDSEEGGSSGNPYWDWQINIREWFLPISNGI